MEAEKFVKEVLQGLWSRWIPKYEELNAWLEKLLPFDYEKSRKVVRGLFFDVDSRVNKPPAAKIIMRLRSSASKEVFTDNTFVPEPGQVYGKEARDKAFADILNGPDTKTKQWLVRYLEKKYPGKKENERTEGI